MSTQTLNTANGHFRIDLQGPEGAPVLVFSNSLGTTFEMWDAQAQAFSSHYRVLRYDTRGHGGSVANNGPYSFAQLGGDVLAILDALDIDQAHFCGISMGGLTGLWLGVNAAARMRSNPAPATCGNGSRSAATTRATPASISASAHGGVRP